MKAAFKAMVLFLIMYTGMWTTAEKASAQGYVSFQIFYDNLSPYGYWIDNPQYGYVWVPNVAPGFSPYSTNGYWVFTEAGWTWVSNYPWGWAPFHYGRWYTDPMYGPIWVPGNEWGPGWVTWRHYEGYYGWAPIEPGISISVAYSNAYYGPRDQWRFVRDRDFGRRDIHNYYVNASTQTTIINNSVVINNTYINNSNSRSYHRGPDREEVQTRTGTRVTQVQFREASKPGERINKGELQIYRPRVEAPNAAGQRPTPPRVANLKDVKPASERDPKAQPIRRDQPVKQQVSPKPRNQPAKAQPRREQPSEQGQVKPQQRNQPGKAKPATAPPREQPSKQRQVSPQPKNQPERVQPSQNSRHLEQVKPQPQPQQPEPGKAQPQQNPRRDQPHVQPAKNSPNRPVQERATPQKRPAQPVRNQKGPPESPKNQDEKK